MNVVIPPDLTIDTARCRLRRPCEADLPLIFSATRFPGFTSGMQGEPPKKIEELHEPLAECLQDWDDGIMFSFTIVERSSAQPIGRVGIRKTKYADIWNLGFWMHPDYQGRGYMTEAVAAIVAFGFDRLAAQQIEASYALWNKSSKRVLEKVGMKFVKYVPHAFQKRGRWIEAYKMRIKKQDWLDLNTEPTGSSKS